MSIKQLKEDFNKIERLKIFEIEVLNKKDGNLEHIIFHIELRKNTLCASHIALTNKQERSKKIAFQKVVLDGYFSLDEHLQELYEKCIEAIVNSDFFELV
jgi:hypothetical protein